MRKSIVFTLVTALNIVFLSLVAVHARYSQGSAAPLLREQTELARRLQLTDLCLFTEARSTRHPAMADRFAPFQDHPGAMEHFPSGSLVTPPIKRVHERSP
jgi:hypothetical protein